MKEVTLLEDAINNISQELEENLEFTKHHINQELKNKYYSIIYLCQIYELSKDIKILIENNTFSSAPTIFRSILDCLYNILNMEINPNFIDELAFKSVSDEERRIRLLNRDKSSINYWSELKSDLEKKDMLSDLKKYKNIHNNEHVYRTVYSWLSKNVHNDLLKLENKFFKEMNGVWQINYDTGIKDTDEASKFINSVIGSIYCALDSTLKIHNVKNSTYSEKIIKMSEEVTF